MRKQNIQYTLPLDELLDVQCLLVVWGGVLGTHGDLLSNTFDPSHRKKDTPDGC